jgi:hypothetical protein
VPRQTINDALSPSSTKTWLAVDASVRRASELKLLRSYAIFERTYWRPCYSDRQIMELAADKSFRQPFSVGVAVRVRSDQPATETHDWLHTQHAFRCRHYIHLSVVSEVSAILVTVSRADEARCQLFQPCFWLIWYLLVTALHFSAHAETCYVTR